MSNESKMGPNRGVSTSPPVAASWMGWLLPVGFGVLAVVLFLGSGGSNIPLEPARQIDRTSLQVGPRRDSMTDPPHILVEGVSQTCNGCHQIFRSGSAAGTALNYHTDTRLNHGMNNRCVNCHDAENRERLVLRDGSTVSFAQTPQACAQCHGTVFRDWQRGTHGKTLGSWVTNAEAQNRLDCNECHNPHSPKYEAYTPLPGPNTLRMGTQGSARSHDGGGEHSPLQRWLRGPDAAQSKPSAGNGGRK